MIFKDKISVRNCKYTKNIIYFNDVMIKLSYIVTNFIKSPHTMCKSDNISSASPNHVLFLSKKYNNLYAKLLRQMSTFMRSLNFKNQT